MVYDYMYGIVCGMLLYGMVWYCTGMVMYAMNYGIKTVWQKYYIFVYLSFYNVSLSDRKVKSDFIGKPRKAVRRSPPQFVSKNEHERLVNMAARLIAATVSTSIIILSHK